METRPYNFAENFVSGLVLQEKNDHDSTQDKYDEQLSQSVPHPEELVDELEYVPYSHQTVRAVSICTTLIYLCTSIES
jgi:hypothetical protein